MLKGMVPLSSAYALWGYQDFAAGSIVSTSVTLTANQNGDSVFFDASKLVTGRSAIFLTDNENYAYSGTTRLFSTKVQVVSQAADVITLNAVPHSSWGAVRIWYQIAANSYPSGYTAPPLSVSSSMVDKLDPLLLTEEEIGSKVQAYDATLQSLAGLGTTADRIAYTTGIDTWAETPLTAFSRTLLDDNDALTARTTLGVGTGDSPSFAGLFLSGLAASCILATNGSSAVQALNTATYPSLTELSYVKGVTSAIQAQLDSKLASSLTNGQIWVGNASNVPTAVTMSGDVTITNAGVSAIGALKVTNAMLAGAIADSKLSTISTAGKVSNSATTATSANTASAIVARDASGNFTASTITAALSGNATTATTLATPRTIGGVSFDGSANITVASATGGFTVSGGNLAIGTNSLTMTGSIGSTLSRVTKGWFTDLECTNAIVGSITGNAATVTTNANLTGDVTSVGNATTIASSAVTNSKMANMATKTVKANTTAFSNPPQDVAIAGDILEDTSNVLYLQNNTDVLIGSTNLTIRVFKSDSSTNGYLSSTDWSTFNNKQTSTLTSGQMWIGNVGNVATGVTMSGDITITNAGVTAIGASKVTNTMLSGSIAASKLIGTDIATVGTITSGIWQGTAIVDSYISSSSNWNTAYTRRIQSGLLASRPAAGNPGANYYATDNGIEYYDNGSSWAVKHGAMTGDVTTSANSLATTLATVNSNVGSFGSATQVPVFTVNAKGLVTAVSNTTISGVAPGGSASGDLSGTYPGPTVAKINGATLGTTTATSGNLLIGSGTQWVTNALSGDATLSSSGVLTLASGSVSLSKMANMATASFLGRNTVGTGAPEVLSASTAKSILAIAQADVSGLTTASSPTFAALTLTNITNQLVLGTTRTLTISALQPATASRVGTIRDFNADFVFAQATAAQDCFFTTTASTNVTLPTSGTLATLSGTENFTNKTLDNTNTITVLDGSFTIQRTGSTTKQLVFDVGNITAGQTRTLTMINGNVTIVGTNNTQTLTNKTIGVPSCGTGATSFTAGQILFGNGTSPLATSSNLFYDSANNRFGVGLTPVNYLSEFYSATPTARTMQLYRGSQSGADTGLPNGSSAYGTSYLQIGGLEYTTNANYGIGFGYLNITSQYPACEIGYTNTVTTQQGYGDFYIALRSTDAGTTRPTQVARFFGADSSAIFYGSLLGRRKVLAKTNGVGSPYAITNDDSGTFFTNEGAAAKVYFTLPTLVANLVYGFIVQNTNGLRIIAPASTTIRSVGSVSTSGGYAESTTRGAVLFLVVINTTEVYAIMDRGTWTFA